MDLLICHVLLRYWIFALYWSWKGLIVCKILPQGASLISTPGKPNSENFIFWVFRVLNRVVGLTSVCTEPSQVYPGAPVQSSKCDRTKVRTATEITKIENIQGIGIYE